MPTLVIGNGADDACTPGDTEELFNALGSQDKTRAPLLTLTTTTSGSLSCWRSLFSIVRRGRQTRVSPTKWHIDCVYTATHTFSASIT